jgi:molybdopterin molybdotransferase
MGAHHEPGELVPLGEQRRHVLERMRPLESIELSLLEAHGSVLAEDVTAAEDVPGFANSAMDGFAVVAGDTDVGVELTVVGEVAAGSAPDVAVRPGEAVGIMTGAPLPEGADAILPIERVDVRGGRVTVLERPEPGRHVRAAGESAKAGDVILRAGRMLRAADVGMLAAVGRSSVLAYPQPRVTVISTGDELVEPGATLGPGKIRDSNSYALTALAREAGAVSHRQMFVRDDRKALTEAFEGALVHSDMLVTSGGVSAGRYDLVKQVLADLGDVEFRKVGMKPGMPQAFGFVNEVPCFGLPGNPVSAVVSFEVFVRPAIRLLQGRTDVNRPRVTATLAETVRSPADKVEFVRVRLRRDDGVWHAEPTGEQGSGILRSVVEADGLAEVPADRTEVRAGELLTVHLLSDD